MKRSSISRKAPLRRDQGEAKASVAIPRLPRCKVTTCKQPFQPARSFQTWCSPACGMQLAMKAAEAQKLLCAKVDRKADREKRESLRTRSDWMKIAQAAFNRYVRLRDFGLPCVSCLRFHSGSYDAGHYRTVGSSPALRFDEANVNRQCVPCNQHLHGNTVAYRAELIRRRGQAEVDRIEGPQEPKHYTIDDLKSIIATYRAKARALEKA